MTRLAFFLVLLAASLGIAALAGGSVLAMAGLAVSLIRQLTGWL